MRNFKLTEDEKRAIEIAQEKGMDVDVVGAYIYLISHNSLYKMSPDEIIENCEKHYVGVYDSLQEFAEDNATDANHFPNTFNYVDWKKYIDYLFTFDSDFSYAYDEELDKYFIFC